MAAKPPAADTRLALHSGKHLKFMNFRVESRFWAPGVPLTALGLRSSGCKRFTNSALLYQTHFPSSLRFGCYFLLSELARRQLLPSPASAGGQTQPHSPCLPPFPGAEPSLGVSSVCRVLQPSTAPAGSVRDPENLVPPLHTHLQHRHTTLPLFTCFSPLPPAFVTNICPAPISLPSQLIFLPYPSHLLGSSRPSIIPLLPFPRTWSSGKCPCRGLERDDL